MSIGTELGNSYEIEKESDSRMSFLIKKYIPTPDKDNLFKWFEAERKLTGRLRKRYGSSSWHIDEFADQLVQEKISASYFRGLVKYEMNEAFNKIIKDKINACKAELSDILHVKLTKTINYEKAERVQAQIRVLESLLLEV